ncbi:serine/threonine-protein phosphatase 2A regulatory subunit B' [Nematocida displodere]|uniref:Serine/threonine-protein phosphatase 2A regulatory subunit B n=1 Tax=Nematocida displodere TaxID=1805483 RepID=A0A177EIT1_9MICR|nr:serine/threonine-protein phosphatase 2A regulatory subunit B' [Nematocida displodere]
MNRHLVLSLRGPHPKTNLHPEDDPGFLLGSWKATEIALSPFLKIEETLTLSEREKRAVMRSLLSPDIRERILAYKIAQSLLRKRLVAKDLLKDLLMEYLLDQSVHYGLDLVLSLMQQLGLEKEDISEIYIPLLTKRLNEEIREEIVSGVVEGFKYTDTDYIYTNLLKVSRQLSSKECLTVIEIIKGTLDNVEHVTEVSAVLLARTVDVILRNEHQVSIESLSYLFSDPWVLEQLAPHSAQVVEHLFSTVYVLSQCYWKKTEQFFVCKILHTLFVLSKSTFDASLRLYNRSRYEIRNGVPGTSGISW